MSQDDLFKEIKNGNLSKVKQIISDNPSLLNKYHYGVTPLMFSIESEQEDIALDLCQSPKIDIYLKDNLDSTLLEKAIEYKMYKIIEFLSLNLKSLILNETILNEVDTYLTSSIKAGDSKVSIALIRGNVDVNKPNKLNEYPIQLTVRFNQIETLKEILKKENVFIGTFENGYNPLLDACENDLTEISVLLIENGADVNNYDQDQSWTPLMHAICNNNEVIVSKLLKHNCDLNLIDVNGNTPVHLAVLAENDVILKLLLKNNANKNLTNYENLTPLQIAKLNEDENSINLLK